MDWMLDHLQVLFVIAVAVAAMLQRFKASGRARPGSLVAAPDPEAAERTRRIQEEIRRRIMERRGLAPAPPPAEETSDIEPPISEAPPLIEEAQPMDLSPPAAMAEPADEVGAPMETSAMGSPPNRMPLRLEDLLAARAVRMERFPAAASATPAPSSVGARLQELRSPAGLRRAVVWREILGPPVGLR